MSNRVSRELGTSSVSFETGTVARQADGAVLVQQGATVVLVTAVAAPTPTPKAGDFVPLTCDYRERTYAAGKIPGGFFKREGRPTEKEILSARLMDRPIRPLVPKGFAHEMQVMAAVLSSDGEYDPDILALNGASVALRISSIPFPDALGAVRVGCIDGRFIVNPTYRQLAQSSMDLIVAGTRPGVLLLEAGLEEGSAEQHGSDRGGHAPGRAHAGSRPERGLRTAVGRRHRIRLRTGRILDRPAGGADGAGRRDGER